MHLHVISLSLFPSLSLYLSTYLSICISIYLSIYISSPTQWAMSRITLREWWDCTHQLYFSKCSYLPSAHLRSETLDRPTPRLCHIWLSLLHQRMWDSWERPFYPLPQQTVSAMKENMIQVSSAVCHINNVRLNHMCSQDYKQSFKKKL